MAKLDGGVPRGSPPPKKGGKGAKVRGAGSGKGATLASDEGKRVKE
jgi:hypothetical protein